MYELPDYLWKPQRRGIEQTITLLESGKDVCLCAATGTGKTRISAELLKWIGSKGLRGCFYTNRKLLTPQTSAAFTAAGVPHGIRAAEYEDRYDPEQPHQICSADTEASRVYKRVEWSLHECNLVIVDEAHLNRTEVMRKILRDHRRRGARVVLLTATPIGLSKWADELVVTGKMAEHRECGALVMARVRSIEQPDLSKVKRNATGEFILDGEKRRIYTQTIVGNVLDRWKKYNPDARPTLLYAPGVAESVWFTEKFRDMGVNWCHVDATDAVVDGKRVKLTRTVWQEIMARFKAGDIKGLSSARKLREGVDAPFVYHAILACPIGSLASYIQICGRVLRRSAETPDEVLITDHGGSFLRHGSPNHDRPWKDWWALPERVVSEMHQNRIKDRKEPEPIRCPNCEGERLRGTTCPHCSFEHEKSKRQVIMEDGRLVEKEGNLIAPRRIQQRHDTAERWAKMFWGFRNKKLDKTFSQMYAYFQREYHYAPPRNLPFMPKNEEGWYGKVHAAQFADLHGEPKRDLAGK